MILKSGFPTLLCRVGEPDYALPGPGQGVEGGGGEVGQAKQQGGNLWMIFDSMLCFALPMKVEERAWGRLLVGRMVEEGKL